MGESPSIRYRCSRLSGQADVSQTVPKAMRGSKSLAFKRQNIAHHFAQTLFQQTRQASALFRCLQVGLERVEVCRQRLLALGL